MSHAATRARRTNIRRAKVMHIKMNFNSPDLKHKTTLPTVVNFWNLLLFVFNNKLDKTDNNKTTTTIKVMIEADKMNLKPDE